MSEISILPYLRSLIDFCYNDGTWTKASAGVHRLAEKPPPLARSDPRLHFFEKRADGREGHEGDQRVC